VLLAAARAGLEVAEFAPATVKKSVVGTGGARKEQVGYMVQQLLRLKAPPAPADAADGVAVGLTYLLTRRNGR
jgi:crossover junction endodeoxyribonuclease RuvC